MMEVENVQSPSWPTRTREYIGDVQAEMKRVTWPTWPQVRVRIGDQQTVLPAMTISLSDAGNVKEPNVLGGDILQSFDHWTIDFPRMQLDVGKPLSHATTKPHAG